MFSSGRVNLYTLLIVFPLPQTLVKILIQETGQRSEAEISEGPKLDSVGFENRSEK